MKKIIVIIVLVMVLNMNVGCGMKGNSSNKIALVQQAENNSSENKETIEENGSIEASNWINDYLNIVSSDELICEEYALAYVNGDNIPELIGNNQDAWYQVYSYTMEHKGIISEILPYGTYSREYYYLPYQNSIVSTCVGIGGKGIYEEYYTLNDSGLVHDITIGKLPQTDDDNNLVHDNVGNCIWIYEKNGIKILKKEWEELSKFDEKYINFANLKYYSKEKINLKEIINEFRVESK